MPPAATSSQSEGPLRRRRIIKRLLLTGTALMLIAATLLALTLVYYDRHPRAVKKLLQEAVADAIHGSCTIADLSYSLRAGYLQARGIRLHARTKTGAFGLQIESLAARFSLSGPFGSRRLVVKPLTVKNFAVRLKLPLNLRNPLAGRQSALQNLLTRMRRFWLFKDFVLSAASATSGTLRVGAPGWELSAGDIKARLDAKWRLTLAGRAAFQSTPGAVHAVLPQFAITTDSLQNTGSHPFAGRLQLSGAVLQSTRCALETVTLAMQLSFRPRHKPVAWKVQQLNCRKVAIFGPHALVFKNLSLQGRGTWDFAGAKLNVSQWEVKAGTLGMLAGRAAATLKPRATLFVALQKGSLQIANLVRRLGRPAAASPVQLQVSKPLAVSGWLRLPDGGQGRPAGIHLNGDLHQADVRYTDVRRQDEFRGRLSSTVQVDGDLYDPRISLSAKLRQAMLHGHSGGALHFSATLRAAGHYPRFELSHLTASGRLPNLLVRRRLLSPGFRLSLARGRVDVQHRQLDLPDVAVSLDRLKNLHLAISGRPQRFQVTLRGARNHLLQTAAALNLLPPAWQFKATDRLSVRAVFTRGAWQTISARLMFRDFSFSSPDGQAGAEKIAAEITARASRSAGGPSEKLRVRMAAHSGEILWGRFYADLARRRPQLSADFTYDHGSRRATLADAQLSLANLLQVQARGSLGFHSRAPELALDLKIPPAAAAPLFKWLVAGPFEFDLPALSTLQVGGRVGLDLHLVRRQRHWRMQGRVLWQKGRVATKDGRMGLQGVDLDLPFWSTAAGRSTGRPAALSGKLEVGRLHMPFLPPQPLSLRLLAAPGRISSSGFALETVGGKLQLGPLTASHIFGPQAVIQTRLSIPALQLRPFAAQLHFPLAGAVASGKLDPLVLDMGQGRLSGHGTIRIAAYGGTMKLQNPALASLFSPPPALMLNVTFAGINLEKLTAATSFGRIAGILKGHVRHLVIVDGQPQRFDLLLETVKRQGVAQKISVAAVKNISRIGGAPSPFVGLAGVFAGFLKSFGYRKIGIRATLKNDVFHINGTIRENGKEYLVKKGGLSGVDVVNWNLNNRISFTDMLERLKRIRSSHGRPVVK